MKKNLIIAMAALLSVNAIAQKFDPGFNNSGWKEETIGTENLSGYNDALVQPDKKLLVCGTYSITAFIQDVSVVRYNTDGTLDNNFGSAGKVHLSLDPAGVGESRIARNSDGDLFVTGSHPHGEGRFHICKLTQQGSIDNTFGVNGIVTDSALYAPASGTGNLNAIAIQADGKILVAGYYIQTAPATKNAAWIIRYNTNGTRDNTFGNNGIVEVVGGDNQFKKLLIQPDGKILAGGCSGLIAQQQQDWMVVRFKPDGILDETFGNTGIVIIGMQYRESVKDMALQSDGSIIIGGNCGNGNPTFRIIKLKSNGTNDSSFGTEQTSTTNWGYTKIELQTYTNHNFAGLAVLPDDKIVIAGAVANFKLAAIRFSANGIPDNTFGINAIVDSQFVAANGLSTSGVVLDNSLGRLYVVGGTYQGEEGLHFSAVAAVKIGNATTTGINEYTTVKELTIYPNPVGNELYLENMEGVITVSDLSGKDVLVSSDNSIDIRKLTAGVYMIRCITKNGILYIGRFVKE